jgi:hypothetical protein
MGGETEVEAQMYDGFTLLGPVAEEALDMERQAARPVPDPPAGRDWGQCTLLGSQSKSLPCSPCPLHLIST